jgi:hypothetical protein
MKRVIITGFFLCCLLMLQGHSQAPGNTDSRGKQPASQSAAAFQWVDVGDMKVLKLWETSGPKWPQIAILDLSSEMYKDLQKNPSEFVNAQKIFPVPVRPGSHCTQLETATKGYSGRWFAIIVHRPTSGSVTGSFVGDVTVVKQEK